jgi:hypothetical protein
MSKDVTGLDCTEQEKGQNPLEFPAFIGRLWIEGWWPVAESNHGHADFQDLI